MKPTNGPVIKSKIVGPHKDLSDTLARAGVGTTYAKDVFADGGDGGTFVQTLDASTAFQQMAGDLIPRFSLDAQLPEPRSFEEMLRLNGAPYLLAADTAQELARTLRAALQSGSNPEFRSFIRALSTVANSMETVGVCFSSGRAPSALTVQNMVNSFDHLAEVSNQLGDQFGYHRFAAVASSYREVAAAYSIAATELRRGLPDVGSRDDFLWGMLLGAPSALRDVGVSYEASTRIKFSLAEHEWNSATIPAAVITLTNENGRRVDQFDIPVSDNDWVRMPFMGNIERGRRYLATIKIPGCLTKTFPVSMDNDGNAIRINHLVQGDVDDDNCIDDRDFFMVRDDNGVGGQDADFVPATDVNADGIVNSEDADIVMANLGQCGDDN